MKIINNFFAHWSQKLLHEKKFEKMDWVFYLTVFCWMLKYVIPITLVVLFGTPIVKAVLHVIPTWFTNGLTIAGGMLPVVGIGMLLRYMPVKKYLTYLILGFVAAAYVNIPVLGIALMGGAAAYAIYRHNSEKLAQQTVTTNDVQADEGDDFDE